MLIFIEPYLGRYVWNTETFVWNTYGTLGIRMEHGLWNTYGTFVEYSWNDNLAELWLNVLAKTRARAQFPSQVS